MSNTRDMSDFIGKNINDVLPQIKLYYPKYSVINKGGILLADHQPSRLNINVDDDGTITSFDFG